jgi:hypothetical protein
MGESNTPPVSPREPDVDSDNDDEIDRLGEDDFEVIELEDDNDEEDVADEGDGDQQESEQDIQEDSIDVPDDAIVVFKNHGSNAR